MIYLDYLLLGLIAVYMCNIASTFFYLNIHFPTRLPSLNQRRARKRFDWWNTWIIIFSYIFIIKIDILLPTYKNKCNTLKYHFNTEFKSFYCLIQSNYIIQFKLKVFTYTIVRGSWIVSRMRVQQILKSEIVCFYVTLSAQSFSKQN